VITVSPIDPDYNIDLVARWVSPGYNRANKTLPFAESAYALFPELRGKISGGMTDAQIRKIVAPCVKRKLKENKRLIQKKTGYLQAYFQRINGALLAALADVHETRWPAGCQRIDCYAGYISRCPRNVITKKFWVSCTMDEEEIVRAAVHEMCHFMFYEKWKEIFGAVHPEDLGHPSPRWYLEEMAVDPLLNDVRIRAIVPLEHRAYPQFYSETIAGAAVMDHIKGFYADRDSVEGFIRNAYRFVEGNIEEIIAKCG